MSTPRTHRWFDRRPDAAMARAVRAGAVTAALVIVTGTTSCGTGNVLDATALAAVRAAISARLPGVTATDIDPSGDGFTQSYRLAVRLASTSARSAADARAQARMAARVIWDLADTAWDTLTIHTGCARDACTGITLTVDAAGAQRFWGSPAVVEHRPPISDDDRHHGTAGLVGTFDLRAERPSPVPDGWQLYWPDLVVPDGLDGLDEQTRTAGVDRILAIRWRDTLGSPPEITLNVYVQPPPAPSPPSPDAAATVRPPAPPRWRIRLSSGQARIRFGPRAPDLP
ncbi:hypothetical protein [Amycolatopsis sp. H20-H5]|uniref:hypothetical protein n=1 Tax=Amycolatopsis sp. H20-H5 TaxID=3046309 RepID=UPI002DBF1FBF|nr:hypothetical protein [Amycolatopsis sp. H20-H5]MEC3977772.1 hypothetical protein [Amycolatopsis sp. H20-H5]